jgi:hypothetical protein
MVVEPFQRPPCSMVSSSGTPVSRRRITPPGGSPEGESSTSVRGKTRTPRPVISKVWTPARWPLPRSFRTFSSRSERRPWSEEQRSKIPSTRACSGRNVPVSEGETSRVVQPRSSVCTWSSWRKLRIAGVSVRSTMASRPSMTRRVAPLACRLCRMTSRR